MKRAEGEPNVRVGVADADEEGYLVITVSTGSVHDFHRISLAQARALSLEIIKQVNLAESRASPEDKADTAEPGPAFQFRHQPQT